MPRYDQKRDYQLGDYWLSQHARSVAWCRTWYDPETKQTRRVSLRTADFDEAKQKLTDWFVLSRTKSNEPADQMPLAEVISRYWERHGQHLVSAERTKLSLRYWLDYYGEKTVGDLVGAEVQEGFHQWLRDKGMIGTSVSRVISAGRAAINFAWKRGEITSVPYIMNVSKEERQTMAPRGRPMDLGELSSLFEVTNSESLRLFIIMMLATAGRPDAIKGLTLDRCDVENRLIILNPDGRPQTTKYRPTVRMPEAVVRLISTLRDQHGRAHVVGFGNQPMESVRTAWRGARARAGLDDQVNPYSLRHTMARWLRKEGVPAWEVSAQLGHKRSDLSITEIYAPYDPSYLGNAVKAMDSFFAALRVNSVSLDRILDR